MGYDSPMPWCMKDLCFPSNFRCCLVVLRLLQRHAHSYIGRTDCAWFNGPAPIPNRDRESPPAGFGEPDSKLRAVRCRMPCQEDFDQGQALPDLLRGRMVLRSGPLIVCKCLGGLPRGWTAAEEGTVDQSVYDRMFPGAMDKA